MSNDEVDKLKMRINKLEEKDIDEYVALLEIMSNATFFGNIKKESCQHAIDGQCDRYALKNKLRDALPIATQCRIKDCKVGPCHNHIETTNLTCSLCPYWHGKTNDDSTNTERQTKTSLSNEPNLNRNG